jgi:hypothetical protein
MDSSLKPLDEASLGIMGAHCHLNRRNTESSGCLLEASSPYSSIDSFAVCDREDVVMSTNAANDSSPAVQEEAAPLQRPSLSLVVGEKAA